jgi:hypothetical protein
VEQGERISRREPWSSLGVSSGKSIRSGCVYDWDETRTPFNSHFTSSIFDNVYHTLCIYIGCNDGMFVFMVKSFNILTIIRNSHLLM